MTTFRWLPASALPDRRSGVSRTTQRHLEETLDPVGIGIIGCGNISGAYLTAARVFPNIIKVRAVADMNRQAAEARGAEFNVPVKSVAELLADPEIEIIVNLTVPGAHVQVGLQAIAAGKHVHSEKPLGISLAEAKTLIDAAEAKGLRVGAAPDTFLGGAHQTCRKLIDEGAIGQPIGGTAIFGTAGHERWHPSPAFYYLKGGGPMLDMGPYYITDLVNLLGPVKRVSGLASRLRAERLITSEPLNGTKIPVEVATHVAGTMEFHSGALITIVMSFDIARHDHRPIELYGSEGAMSVPDPNMFGGQIETATAASANWRGVPTLHAYANGNFRMLGAADMAQAIRTGRPHRASGALAFHVLEVMEAFQRSSDEGVAIAIESRPERPAMLPVDLVNGVLD
jgi:predicted dehydrogenase